VRDVDVAKVQQWTTRTAISSPPRPRRCGEFLVDQARRKQTSSTAEGLLRIDLPEGRLPSPEIHVPATSSRWNEALSRLVRHDEGAANCEAALLRGVGPWCDCQRGIMAANGALGLSRSARRPILGARPGPGCSANCRDSRRCVLFSPQTRHAFIALSDTGVHG
jgi:hypothetical protein